MNKVLLIDGNSMLNRAYFAMPEWRNRSGEATAGVYGFLSMMLKGIEQVKATHLIVVFDSKEGDNFRKAMYVGYHANRGRDEQIETDIWSQVDKLKQVFEMLKVPVYQAPGFEADDAIGTICKKVVEVDKNIEVIAVTGDRDLMQLVNKRVQLMMPQRALTDTQLVDEEGVMTRLGVKPEQVIDYKALVGDSSDNYPGIPGVGPTTAVNLLKDFDNFEEIIEAAKKEDKKIKPAVIKKLIAGEESGKLSKQLATIRTDVPLKVDIDEAVIPKEETMVEVFKQLGHRSLIRRVSGENVEIDDNQQKLFE